MVTLFSYWIQSPHLDLYCAWRRTQVITFPLYWSCGSWKLLRAFCSYKRIRCQSLHSWLLFPLAWLVLSVAHVVSWHTGQNKEWGETGACWAPCNPLLSVSNLLIIPLALANPLCSPEQFAEGQWNPIEARSWSFFLSFWPVVTFCVCAHSSPETSGRGERAPSFTTGLWALLHQSRTLGGEATLESLPVVL